MKALTTQNVKCMVETTLLTTAYSVLLYLGVKGVLAIV